MYICAIMIINIFDFDDTLFLTPKDCVKNRELYKAKTGNDYPHIGWYSKPETLDDTVFDIPENTCISNIARESIDSNYMTFVLTGRIHKLNRYVKKLCIKNDLLFDRFYCTHSASSTLEYKKSVLYNIHKEFDTSAVVNFYDDRYEHMDELYACGKALFNNFKYYLVVND